MPQSPYTLQQQEEYQYIDEGPRGGDTPPLVLLHGMLGDLSNWTSTIQDLVSQQFRTIVPLLPVYDRPLTDTNVSSLAEFLDRFVDAIGLDKIILVGNSLGGHVALLYACDHPEKTEALILSGASGIYEVEMGTSVFRRKDREELRRRAAFTFFDPVHATEELVDEVYGIVNDRRKALRLIRMARAVQAESVANSLGDIGCPTLLIWGEEDRITPPDVAETFREGIRGSRLHYISKCGHAPMIESPHAFNQVMIEFVREIVGTPVMSMSGL